MIRKVTRYLIPLVLLLIILMLGMQEQLEENERKIREAVLDWEGCPFCDSQQVRLMYNDRVWCLDCGKIHNIFDTVWVKRD